MKNLTWDQYCPKLPKLLTVTDLIQYHVNKEAEVMIEDQVVEPPSYELVERPPQGVGFRIFIKSLMP